MQFEAHPFMHKMWPYIEGGLKMEGYFESGVILTMC